MLVACFGYTHLQDGQVQVYERITGISRELLMQIKELAEDMGFEVLHGIVDCLWVIGEPISAYKEAVEKKTASLPRLTPMIGSHSFQWQMVLELTTVILGS